ncbi:MAG: hypothetical protein ACE5OZ_24430 [Candidatus Heimdallarchaeota archaeon]
MSISQQIALEDAYLWLDSDQRSNKEIADIRKEYPLLRVLVIGVGLRGGEVVDRLTKQQVPGLETAVADTRLDNLYRIRASQKIIIDESRDDWDVVASYKPRENHIVNCNSLRALENSLAGVDMVFIISGLSGFSGTSVAQTIAKRVKEHRVPIISVCHVPYQQDVCHLTGGLQSMQNTSNALIIVPNETLPKVPLKELLAQGFAAADEPLSNAVKDLLWPEFRLKEQNEDSIRKAIENISQQAANMGFPVTKSLNAEIWCEPITEQNPLVHLE